MPATVEHRAVKPLVSVIIPTHNSARYIQQAVESVFQQTYPAYEVVVVDDGSTDDTRRALGPYMERIRYAYQENQGPSAARNHGLGLARGEFVAFLDSDDYLLPGALTEWLARFDSKPSLGVVHSGWRLVNQDGEVLRDVEPWDRVSHLDLETWVTGGPMCLGAMLFRRRWLDRAGAFDPELRQGEDTDLALRLALLGCKMAWLRKLTMCYRQHDYSATQGAVEQARYREMVLDKFFARPDVPDRIRGLENEVRLNASLWSVWRLYATGHMDLVAHYLRRSLAYSSEPPEQLIWKWVRLFANWLSREGRPVSEFNALVPHFRAAAGLDHEEGSETEEQLCWCMDVWWHYMDDRYEYAVEGLKTYRGLAPRRLVSLAQSSLLVTPPGKMVPLIERLWEDAKAGQLVPASYEHEVTSLYLTAFGQAALMRRRRLAWEALRRALRWGYHPRAMGAWFRFFHAALVYFLGRPRDSVQSLREG